MSEVAQRAWDKVRGDELPYEQVGGDFRARLEHAASEVQRTGVSTGIAGLEKFEEEVAKAAKVDVRDAGVDAAAVEGSVQARLTDGVTPEDIGITAEAAPKASARKGAKKSGASKTAAKKSGGKAKALKDAAAAGQRVEADEVHSPSFPSAARPLAAESPGNQPQPSEKKAAKKSTSAKK